MERHIRCRRETVEACQDHLRADIVGHVEADRQQQEKQHCCAERDAACQ